MADPCPHCGPTCYGGAAHNARREDGVMHSDTKPHAELPKLNAVNVHDAESDQLIHRIAKSFGFLVEATKLHVRNDDDSLRCMYAQTAVRLLGQLDQRESQLLAALQSIAALTARAEKAERERDDAYELARDTRENLVIVRMDKYADMSGPQAAWALYSLWQDALHQPNDCHPENRDVKAWKLRAEAAEAELARLRTNPSEGGDGYGDC